MEPALYELFPKSASCFSVLDNDFYVAYNYSGPLQEEQTVQNTRYCILLPFPLILIFFLFFSIPSPQYLFDSDAGQSLSGAEQILLNNEHPFRDFYMDYGPLVFYASWFFQWVSGQRLLGEILLCALGLAVTYTIFFNLLLKLGAPRFHAVIILIFGLVAAPTFFLWYWPLSILLTLAAALYYLRKGSNTALALLGSTLAIAALFRHDYGVYCAFGATTAILCDSRYILAIRLKKLALLGTIALAFFSPWLLFLAESQALPHYFHYIISGSFNKGVQFSLPHPLFHWGNPLLSIFYVFVFSVPVAGIFVIARSQWRAFTSRRLSSFLTLRVPEESALCYTVIVMAFSQLMVASHRADYVHLQFIMPSAILALLATAILLGKPLRRIRVGNLAAIVSFFAILSLTLSVPPVSNLRSFALAAMPREKFIDTLYEENQRKYWKVDIQHYLYHCTDPKQRIAVWPWYEGQYYILQRLAAGKLLVAVPGFFNSPEFQQESIEALKQQDISFIIWGEKLSFDFREERNAIFTHSILWDFVRTHYKYIGHIGPLTVYSPNDLDALQEKSSPECRAELSALLAHDYKK